MKTITMYLMACIFTLCIISVQLYSQPTVALIVGDKNNISEREDSTQNMLQTINYNVVLVNYDEANYDVLKDYHFTVAVNDGAISLRVINQLIENNNGIILLNDSGKSVGGTWAGSSSFGVNNLFIEEGVSFLDGYQSSLSFPMQSVVSAYFISGNYPGGWTILGRNTWRSNHKTTLVSEHISGGRGLILTYDPRFFTDVGKNIFLLAVSWVGKEPPLPGVIVPSGNVALVIIGSDDAIPLLTGLEKHVQNRLELLGYDITYIPFGLLKNSDLSGSKFVVGVHFPSIDSRTANNLISNGKGVILLRAAGSSIGGLWNSYWDLSHRNLIIENGIAYLDGYESTVPFTMQSGGDAYYIASDYPGGWSILGRNASTALGRKTTLVREHVSGGRGVILTYDPSYYTAAAENIFLLMTEWISGDPSISGITVPSGNVSLILKNYFSSDPTLTENEIAVKYLLEKLGYNITPIPFGLLKNSDLSGSKFVVGVHFPSMDSKTANNLISNGKGVLLLHTAGSSIGGSWSSRNDQQHRNIIIENGIAYLDGYESTVPFTMQSGELAYCIASDYPFGWSILGRNTLSESRKTTFTREHPSGGRGVLLTYDPRHFTSAAENIFLMATDWIAKEYSLPAVVVPPGDVAFVIQGSDEDPQVLSVSEDAIRQWLEFMGYTITYIRSGNLRHSDLLGANFIIATQFPALDSTTIEYLLLNEKNVILLHTAGSTLGGVWGALDRTEARSIAIERNEAYLDEYKIGDTYTIQRESGAYYILQDYPKNWSIIGKNTWRDQHKTAFFKSSSGKGTILTYNPRFFNEEGENLLQSIINWSTLDVEAPTIPLLVYPENGATDMNIELFLSWEETENAESYSLQLSNKNDFSNLIVDEKNISDTSYAVSDLDDNTLYYWRVRAANAGIASGWSNVWNFTTGDVTSVRVDLGIPREYSLYQNYPNPFNPTTVIRYGIPERFHIIFTMYNRLGQKLTTFVNEEQDAGFYEVTFDASQLPSGLYIYRLQAGEYVESRKMLYLK